MLACLVLRDCYSEVVVGFVAFRLKSNECVCDVVEILCDARISVPIFFGRFGGAFFIADGRTDGIP